MFSTRIKDNPLYQNVQKRWHIWLSRRLPANKNITLNHKSIFILPTSFGLFWLFIVLLLFLFGTNYQNNLIIGLSILLLSLFNTCIIFSYRNLAGLSLQTHPSPNAYAGDTLVFPIKLSAHQRLNDINLNYPKQTSIVINQVTQESLRYSVPFENNQRGLVNPGRLKVESCFPLGLFRVWSHLDLDNSQLVFPTPIKGRRLLTSIDDIAPQTDTDTTKTSKGVDDYRGLKPYVLGESLKQLAWKQLAQGKGKLTKEFEQPQSSASWLELTELNSSQQERAISELTYLIIKLTQQGQLFGLKVGNKMVEPNSGEKHSQECLSILAKIPRYPIPSLNSGKSSTPGNQLNRLSSLVKKWFKGATDER